MLAPYNNQTKSMFSETGGSQSPYTPEDQTQMVSNSNLKKNQSKKGLIVFQGDIGDYVKK